MIRRRFRSQMHPRLHLGARVREAQRTGRARVALPVAVALVGVLCSATAVVSTSESVASSTVTPPRLYGKIGGPGSGAGQIGGPVGIATEPAGGHLLVEDFSNNRIDEFTPWGGFVKAFGWDVAPGAVNEQQEIRVRATAGQFKLGFGVSTTPDLPFDASAAEVQAALNALPSVSVGGGSLSVSGGPGGTPGTTPSVYVVAFDGGPLAAANVAQLSAADGSTPLSGGAPSTELATATRADGAAAGTGLESCTTESGCQAGAGGSGAGQLSFPEGGIAVDAEGDIYVFEQKNLRVQKFDPAGRFLLMFGGEVNKTSGEDVCTRAQLEGGDVCGAGVAGTGDGQFASSVSGIAVGPDGTVYVGDKDRIQEFNPDGSFKGQIKFADLHAGTPGFPAGGDPGALAVDPISGDLYFDFHQRLFEKEKVPNIFKISPGAGSILCTLPAIGPEDGPEALATDQQGNLFAVDHPVIGGFTEERRVIEFDSNCNPLIGYEEGFPNPGEPGYLASLATNKFQDLFLGHTGGAGYISAYGPLPLALEPPPRVAPTISDPFAASVDGEGAVVRATINPHFWADTSYYVEYGTAPCAAGPCAARPTPPGTLLSGAGVDAPLATAGVFLGGLQPATTYHFRFVAQSSGGGPVSGPEATFTTPRAAEAPNTNCPNQGYRSGPSARLPDCRAYEMVSPVDKNGGDVFALCDILCIPAGLDQSAASGEALTYSSYKSFGDAQSAPYTSQYLARRGAGGWSSEGISPPQQGPSLLTGSTGLDSMFKAFSPGLDYGWLMQDREPALSEEGGAPNLYRRSQSGGSYQALVPGPGMASYPELQGTTPDGRCAIFRAGGKLTGNAKKELVQLYESCASEGGQELTLLSVLPGGAVSTTPSSAGTPTSGSGGHATSVFQALSADGSRVYWSQAAAFPGPLYVRIGIGGPEPRTLAVSKGNARFWGAAADGSRAIFAEGDGKELYEYDLAEESARPIAGQAEGVVGMSADASRVYLVSGEALAAGAEAGEPNLYLYEAPGSFRLVATLSDADVKGQLSPVAPEPIMHTARVSGDGLHAAFMSRAPLSAYANSDQKSGEADAEVFLYDAGSEELHCVSCNPTGARPTGRELQFRKQPTALWAAAQIPTFETQLYGSRALAEDGSRLFFESFEALVPADTNARQDVYEWEAAGSGDCTEALASFQAAAGGCVRLISSGQSPDDSSFVDATPDGRDVFLATGEGLLPQDPGLLDIYDAREGGGFPPPPSPPALCEGEACQGPPPPPADPTPASLGFSGAGNPVQRLCPKGRHKARQKGKLRCVRNHTQKQPRGHHHRRTTR